MLFTTLALQIQSLKRFFASFFVISCCLVACQSVSAQQWASKMFDTQSHDFGVVARGSDTVYRFEVKNIYKEDIEISSVRSSCGCTSPSIENRRIKTYEKAYIVAKFNTRTFTGPHSATLTVRISKPYPAQVQLRVHGNIRGDVVFEPGSVDFDTVSQGTNSERTLGITYAGHSNWRIDDVRSVSEFLEAELIEKRRNGGRVNYDLLVRLRENAPAGFIKDQIILVTNDRQNPRIPIDVVGKVNAELTVAPQNLALGELTQGETITKRLIVRSKQPFVVTNVDSSGDESFSYTTSDQPATRQMITLTYSANREPGKFEKPLKISTSLGDSYTVSCLAYATVKPSPLEESTASPDSSSTKTASTLR